MNGNMEKWVDASKKPGYAPLSTIKGFFHSPCPISSQGPGFMEIHFVVFEQFCWQTNQQTAGHGENIISTVLYLNVLFL